MSVTLKSGLLVGSCDPEDREELDLLCWQSTKESWENLLELLFVLCAICHGFPTVTVKVLCVRLDCMCSVSFCGAIYCSIFKDV